MRWFATLTAKEDAVFTVKCCRINLRGNIGQMWSCVIYPRRKTGWVQIWVANNLISYIRHAYHSPNKFAPVQNFQADIYTTCEHGQPNNNNKVIDYNIYMFFYTQIPGNCQYSKSKKPLIFGNLSRWTNLAWPRGGPYRNQYKNFLIFLVFLRINAFSQKSNTSLLLIYSHFRLTLLAFI